MCMLKRSLLFNIQILRIFEADQNFVDRKPFPTILIAFKEKLNPVIMFYCTYLLVLKYQRACQGMYLTFYILCKIPIEREKLKSINFISHEWYI